MSIVLETLNKGSVENFGFVFDATRIRLSDDLRAISVPQFCRYSTEAIVEAYQLASDDRKVTVLKHIEYLRERTKALRVVPYEGPDPITRETTSEPMDLADGTDIIVRNTQWPQKLSEELGQAIQTGYFSNKLRRNLQTSFSEELGVNIHDYKENPFRLKGAIINIGGLYDVDIVHFSYLSIHILGGGFGGWGDNTIPECAMNGVNKLAQLLPE